MQEKIGWYRQLGLLFAILYTIVIGMYPQSVEASEINGKEIQIQEKIELIQLLHSKVEAARSGRSQAAAQRESANKKYQDSKAVFDKVKESYSKATQNPELVQPEEMARLTREYQISKKDMSEAEQTLKLADTEIESRQAALERLEGEKSKANEDIQQLKAEIFDLKMQEPVWAEGYGEAVQSEDKTPLQCRELALNIARRDAVERGGKALLKSITTVEMFQLKEDSITVSSYAQIVDQDDSNDYGKLKKVTEGDNTKYMVKVHLKITAAGVPNPFRGVTSNAKQPVPTRPAVTDIETDKIQARKPTNIPRDMVLVEGGTFQMGDTLGVGEGDEQPVHKVTVRSFYMSVCEITFKEYDAFCDDTGRIKPADHGWGRGQRPVIAVSWHDAVAYCKWRSTQEGLEPFYKGNGNNITCDVTANGYRLPTEAEWEYAAKGGREGGGYRYSGSNDVNNVAWYSNNGEGMTHPVGQKTANELGIYDMSGNVWEWCWDWYGKYQRGDVDNPLGAATGTDCVLRGGARRSDAKDVRVTVRDRNVPDFTSYNVGFRIVRNL